MGGEGYDGEGKSRELGIRGAAVVYNPILRQRIVRGQEQVTFCIKRRTNDVQVMYRTMYTYTYYTTTFTTCPSVVNSCRPAFSALSAVPPFP